MEEKENITQTDKDPKFEEAQIEVILFDTKDILRTSGDRYELPEDYDNQLD